MNRTELSVNDINPYVRLSHFTLWTKNNPCKESCAYDCRLFFVSDGSGNIKIGEKEYFAECNSLFIIMPGLSYSINTENSDGIKILMFNFDYSCNSTTSGLLVPESPVEFNPDTISEFAFFSDCHQLNDTIYIENAHHLRSSLLDVYNEFVYRRLYSARRASMLFGSVLLEIARSVQNQGRDFDKKAAEIVNYIHSHSDCEITCESLGKFFHYHPNYIRRLITDYTGLPTHKYILECRLSRALELLLTTDFPISGICSKTGFSDISHFSKAFKMKYGKSPSHYRHN